MGGVAGQTYLEKNILINNFITNGKIKSYVPVLVNTTFSNNTNNVKNASYKGVTGDALGTNKTYSNISDVGWESTYNNGYSVGAWSGRYFNQGGYDRIVVGSASEKRVSKYTFFPFTSLYFEKNYFTLFANSICVFTNQESYLTSTY